MDPQKIATLPNTEWYNDIAALMVEQSDALKRIALALEKVLAKIPE